MQPVDKVLPCLRQLRQRQPGQWSACCPAHEDNTPSLSIRETPQGSILLHCFGGCEVAAIVQSLGLQLHELFPPNTDAPLSREHYDARLQTKHRLPRLLTSAQALALLHVESLVIAMAGSSLARSVPLNDADRQRLLQAANRVAYLHEEATGRE